MDCNSIIFQKNCDAMRSIILSAHTDIPFASSRPHRVWEMVFVVVSFICLSGGLINPLLAQLKSPSFNPNSNTFDLVVFYGINLISAILIIPYLRTVIVLIRKEHFIALLLSIAFLSALWSDVPFLTFRKTIGLSGTTLFGLYFAIRYDLKQQLRLLALFFFFIILSSFIVGFATPYHGIGAPASLLEDRGRIVGGIHHGAWRGVFYNKNLLGAIMVLSALAFSLIDTKALKSWVVKATLLILSVIILLLSHSKTSLMVFIILLFLSQLYNIVKLAPRLKITIYCLIVCITIPTIPYLFLDSDSLLAALGRNPTLTGRTELWAVIMNMIARHPFLGYGYNSVWIQGHRLDYIQSMVNWPVTHAHNGYLDLWLQLGALGLSVFAIGICRTLRVALSYVRSLETSSDLWPLMYISFLLIYNITETAILTNNSFFWALYVAATMSIFHHYPIICNTKSYSLQDTR